MDFLEKLTPKSHVGYVVENVDAALKSLQDTLCCATEATAYAFRPTKAWCCGLPINDLELRIAMCQIKDGVAFEYIQPVSPSGFHLLSLLSNGDSINHVCFTTDDFDHYHQEFENMGATIVFEAEANDPLNGYRRCFYSKLNDIPGIIEVLQNATPYRPDITA